jgi:glycosyltransferase involved in cell wall biosynthesis/SAM-dependent methyltransferase
MHACTIIARNYLPYARVLADSFLEHHPHGRFTALILGGHEDSAEKFDVVGPYDIGIERTELHRMAMIYGLKELATAVKPWFLRRLLDDGAEVAAYFDPDIALYGPLNDIEELALKHAIVLTPHTTEPIPDDGCLPDYKMILQAGVYNLGFIAVGSGAATFLNWWSDRLARHCLVAVEEALFVDQRWVDLVPALFDHFVLLDPASNVAYWNLHGRRLTWGRGRYEVNEVPLRFFHFSGFKPDTPHILSHHMGTRPRILLSDYPDVARLCDEYAQQVLSRGYGRGENGQYAFDRLPGGVSIDGSMRRLFREELLESERGGRSTPPDPFDPTAAASFIEWLRAPARNGRRIDVSRYAYALYMERPDLQRAFPDVFGSDGPRYVQWLHDIGQAQEGFAEELLPGPPRSATMTSRTRTVGMRAMVRAERRLRALAYSHPALARGKPAWRALKRLQARGASRILKATTGTEQPDRTPAIEIAAQPAHGVNLVGYLSAELGIGEVARKIMAGLERAEVDFSTIAYDRTLSRQAHRFEERLPQQAPFDTNIICVNADQLPIFREEIGLAFFANRRSIGVWFWEVSQFPAAFHDAFRYLDEVWVATSFVRDAISATTSMPVEIIPLPLEVPRPQQMSRQQLGVLEGFLFLFSFDFLSIFERKHPLGVLEAFTRAFADGEGPVLVLKSINGEHDLASVERLRLAAAERSDIHVINGYVSPEEKNALMAGCDCYVSLHRSEGLGLTMAEAMAYAKPVIATGYSGNVDFMNEENSYLIPYTLVPIPKGCDPYPVGAAWADPDLDAAAEAMRRVYEDQDAARELGRRAREDILGRFSVERTAAFLAQRIDRGGARPGASVEPSIPLLTANEPLAMASAKLALGPGGYFARAKRRRPGVRSLRAALRRLLWPYILDQHELSVAVIDAVGHVQRQLESLNAHVREFEGADAVALENLGESLSRLESELTAVPYVSDPAMLRVTDTKGRSMIGYDAGVGSAGGLYQGFEDTFRGSEQFIRERQKVYLDVIGSRAPVLDVGCGRGEFLELLAEAGIEAWGVDRDPGMVARCREKGLAVQQADAISYLKAHPDGSMGVVFSAQVIEHLSYEELFCLFQLGEQKLVPGGLFVAETVNPHSIQAFKTFWVDPTHRAPIFPEVAVTLARLHGFDSAHVLFPLGTGDLEVDRRSEGEYVVVATSRT